MELPMSTTIMASLISFSTKNAAPLILFVGPLENVRMGKRAADTIVSCNHVSGFRMTVPA